MSQIEFDDAVAKGERLFHLLTTNLNDPNAPHQSIFTAYTDLAHYGYIEEPPPEPFSLQPLQECLQSLGVDHVLDVDQGRNIRIYHTHSKEVTIDGVTYPATHAYFSQLYNPTQGVLIAASNATPPHTGISCDPPTTLYPPLHHWSDVAYLQMRAPSILSCTKPTPPITPSPPPTTHTPPTPPPPTKLTFIIRYCCQNPGTNAIVNYILRSPKRIILPKWPGLCFPIELGCREGIALLGSPNGAGVGWMLAERKRMGEVGGRRVVRVGVFYAEGEGDVFRWPSLVFWVGDGGEGVEGEEVEGEDRRGVGADHAVGGRGVLAVPELGAEI